MRKEGDAVNQHFFSIIFLSPKKGKDCRLGHLQFLRLHMLSIWTSHKW